MLSGAELLTLLLIAGVLVGIIVLAAALRRPRVADTDEISTIVVGAEARTWLADTVAELHRLPAHSVAWLSRDVVLVTWTRRSGWVFIVALLLFPFGLLALLFTTDEHGTLAIVDDGPPGTVSIGGTISNAAADIINAHVADSVSPPATRSA